MGTGIYFTIEAFIYLFILMIIYFNKRILKSEENSVYTVLIIITFFEIVTEIILDFVGPFYKTMPALSFSVARLYCVLLIIWNCHICLYITIVSLKMKQKEELVNKVRNILLIVCCIFVIVSLFLPIYFKYGNDIAYTYGGGVNTVYVSGFFYIIISTLLFLWNYRQIKDKRFIPTIVLITFGSICSLIQFKNPALLLTTAVHTFITFLMYFTIENPDLKMIEELSKAESLSESTNTEKSNFLFTVTNDINNSLNEAEKIYMNIKELHPEENVLEQANRLKALIDVSRIKTRETIDVSELDSKVLRPITTKYDPNLLIQSIYNQLKFKINDKVDFRLNINELPKELYGDSIKLKQIIVTLLNNAIIYTKEGFIELRINTIIKHDICRLIISIEDSGTGIDLLTQKQILSNHDELTEEEIKGKDDLNLNLKIVKKMISLMGGSMTISSIINKGSTIKVIINQNIVKEEKDKELKLIQKYSEEIQNKKRIAIITQDKEHLKILKKVTKKEDLIIDEFDVTLNCLINIRKDIKYDLIIIEEDMEKIDARSFLYKAKMTNNFSAKVIVLSSTKDFKVKKELFNLGFDIISVPINKEDAKNKIENILKNK